MKTWMIAVLALASPAFAQTTRPVKEKPNTLQRLSVTIKTANNKEGSGTIFSVPMEVGGERVAQNFVLTAAHVVSHLRSVETVIARDGRDRKVVKFRDAAVVQEEKGLKGFGRGRKVMEYRFDAKVIKYDSGYDLALLMIYRVGFKGKGARFYLGREIPECGTDLWHVGSLGGQELGASSLTGGRVSSIGRIFADRPYDQTDVTAIPGSSGGGVFLASTHELVGVLTMGIRGGDSINWIVPAREVLKWARRGGILWAFDPSVKPPTEDVLRKLRIEDTGRQFDDAAERRIEAVRRATGRKDVDYMLRTAGEAKAE